MTDTINVSDATFKTEILDAEQLVLVDIWAGWCAPCRLISPVVEALSLEYIGRVKFAKLDSDANPETVLQFGVMAIPTLLLFRDGKVVRRITGFQPKAALKSQLESELAA
jgi:thioredoxin 1